MAESRENPNAEDVSNWVFLAVAIGCNFIPSLAFQIAPGGEVGEKEELFLKIYLITLPLSLAMTGIIFIWLRNLFESDRQRLAASAGLLVVSGLFGLGFGTSQVDQELFAKVHGPPEVVLFAFGAYILFSYAVYYGWALFISSVAVSFAVGLWLHEKLPDSA